jgi:hypothetical protein
MAQPEVLTKAVSIWCIRVQTNETHRSVLKRVPVFIPGKKKEGKIQIVRLFMIPKRRINGAIMKERGRIEIRSPLCQVAAIINKIPGFHDKLRCL